MKRPSLLLISLVFIPLSLFVKDMWKRRIMWKLSPIIGPLWLDLFWPILQLEKGRDAQSLGWQEGEFREAINKDSALEIRLYISTERKTALTTVITRASKVYLEQRECHHLFTIIAAEKDVKKHKCIMVQLSQVAQTSRTHDLNTSDRSVCYAGGNELVAHCTEIRKYSITSTNQHSYM